jgi:hypothetical protein
MDVLNTILIARRGGGMFRPARLFYRATWRAYSALALHIESGPKREGYLSVYGPVSVLLLLSMWAGGLMIAFAMLQWAAGLQVSGLRTGWGDALYFSASTALTLLPGSPNNILSRVFMVLEAGLGIGSMALVIGYLPVLYQSFASRERSISMLDARAGTPPSAGELLRREAIEPRWEAQLASWEQWFAELLESHISYPMLAYFRSQHYNQSWLAALTSIVDAAAISSLGAHGTVRRQAEVTFAMGRHALVDLGRHFCRAAKGATDRLPHDEFDHLQRALPFPVSEPELARLRASYEPYAEALAHQFLLALPPWLPREAGPDNWQTTPRAAGFAVSDPFREENGRN